MIAKHWIAGLALPLGLLLGCGSDNGGSGGTGGSSGYPSCSDCMHSQYVVGPKTTATTDHGITLPATATQATMLACDQGGADNTPDNRLGSTLLAIAALASNLNVQMAIDDAFAAGQVIILADVEYKPSITMTTVAGVKAYLGSHDTSDGQTAPGYYGSGTGKFTAMASTNPGLGGAITAGAGVFGKGPVTIKFPLADGQPPLTTTLINVQLKGTFSATGITNGIICGAIAADDLMTTILPQVATLLSAQVKTTGSTAMGSIGMTLAGLFDTSPKDCDTDPACQPNAPGTCMCISEAEVEGNALIKQFLGPDLDLDPNKHNPFVTDTTDPNYKNDALSVGLGFEASTATFTAP